MAASFPEIARACAACTILCCCAAVAAPTEKLQPLPRPSRTQPIDLVADSSDVDYKNNTLLFRNVTVTQGPLRAEAKQATSNGLNFDNSDWTLTGDVKITSQDGKLTSNDAKLTFRDNEIARAVVRGTPAEFEQRMQDSQQMARGRASTIDFDFKANTVTLTGEAWLSDGDNTIRGDVLVYDVDKQRVAANPGSPQPGGVHITFNPQSQAKPDAKTPDKTAPPKAEPPK
jgi:lipopolysaccharide transport protein LptA